MEEAHSGGAAVSTGHARDEKAGTAHTANNSSSGGSSGSSGSSHHGDLEAQAPSVGRSRVSHFRRLVDQAGVTPQVLAYRFPGDGTEASPFLVDFVPDDPWNPMAQPVVKKWLITISNAIATLAVSFASSAYTGGVLDILQHFDVSDEVAILGISMFVAGFAIGPLFWAPLSEMYGRQRLFFGSYMALTIFNSAACGAPNMAALVVFRFLAGAFGSSPLTNAGGVIADMFPATQRGIATSIFAMAPFLGPALGPIAGGFLGETAGWRWVLGMIAIFTGFVWILIALVYPETYAPVILRSRAAILSRKTGMVYVSKIEAGQPRVSTGARFRIALSRPWILLFHEPIVLLTSIYMAIIYGTLYMCFAAFPIVFEEGRGWSTGIGGLSFLGIAVGMSFATVGTMLDNKRYQRVSASHHGMAPPETRLPPAIVGSVLLPIGLFWFAWTNGSEINFMVPIIGSAFFAAGIVLVFLSLMNYLIDSYVIFAASVLAANSVLRSLFGMAFPLFTTYMFRNLGIHWASSLPGFLALACVPFPFLFYRYGHKIRMRCEFAAEAAEVLQRMRSKQPAPATEQEAFEEAEELEEERKEERRRRSSEAAASRRNSTATRRSHADGHSLVAVDSRVVPS